MPRTITLVRHSVQNIVGESLYPKLCAVILTSLLIASCGQKPIDTQAPDGSDLSLDEIAVFIQQAREKEGVQGNTDILNAAHFLMRSNELDWARITVNSLNRFDLNPENYSRFLLINGRIEQKAGDPFLAYRFLMHDELDVLFDQISDDTQIELREFRANLLFDLTEYEASIVERVIISSLETDFDLLSLNQDVLWQTLMQLPKDMLIRKSQEERNPVLQGWYSLAALGKNNQSNIRQQISDIENWIAVWPDHPASTNLPADLILLRQLAESQANQLALLLPLSGKLGNAAKAIQDGFFSAYFNLYANEQIKPNIRIYDTGVMSAADAYQMAINEGAETVIGPLEKQAVTEIAALEDIPVPTLALNTIQAAKTVASPAAGNEVELITPEMEIAANDANSALDRQEQLYFFGLAVEKEASQIAEKAWRDGRRRALIIAPASEWGDRGVEEFKNRWIELGGELVDDRRYKDRRSYSKLIESAVGVSESKQRNADLRRLIGEQLEFEPRRRKDIDYIFLLAHPEQGRLLKPLLAFHYAGDIAVYSTSQIFNGKQAVKANLDVNNINFITIPWFFNENLKEKKSIDAYTSSQASYQQLYALGIDAFYLYPRLQQLQQLQNARFYGVTGKLSVNTDNQVVREQIWAKFVEGRLELLSNKNSSASD